MATQRAALRQALDEDLRRFIREGIIAVTDRDDTQVVIDALRGYIRRQRNPLLDRLALYGRKQQTGKSFDNFYTSLNELYKASDFGLPLCQPCTSRVCGNCSAAVSQHTTDMMRDRVVCGILDDAVRHKLLAEPNLTLDKAAKICRAEEAAQQSGDSLPSSGQVNAARHQSSYKRRQASSSKSSSGPKPPPASGSHPASSPSTPASRPNSKCSACGRTPHTKNPCPALGRTCGRCHQKGHFASMCPQTPQRTVSNVAHLSLSRASAGPSAGCISVATQLRHASTPCPLTWLPDTGSNVNAIGLRHLSALGGAPADLSQDVDTVYTADGRSLSSLGKVSATLFAGSARHPTTIHVYDGLTDALLSKASLAALGYLPQGWPQHVRRTAQAPPQAEVDCLRAELMDEFSLHAASQPKEPPHGRRSDPHIPVSERQRRLVLVSGTAVPGLR